MKTKDFSLSTIQAIRRLIRIKKLKMKAITTIMLLLFSVTITAQKNEPEMTYTFENVRSLVSETLPELDSNSVYVLSEMIMIRFLDKDREEGHYWVFQNGRWTIGKYWMGQWYLFGTNKIYQDKDFDNISEQKIPRKINIIYKDKVIDTINY